MVAREAVVAAINQMVFWSREGGYVAPRYRLAVLAYGETVEDVVGGIRPIDETAAERVFTVRQQTRSDAAAAFAYVERLIQTEINTAPRSPAPLVCHLTDGLLTGDDAAGAVKRLSSLGTSDGPVLVEHVFVSDRILLRPIRDPKQWTGVGPTVELSAAGQRLRALSSTLPESYRHGMLTEGYRIDVGAAMMFPATHPELVRLALVRSASGRSA